MELVVETLIVDEHRIGHIARHDITIEEVLEVISNDFVYIRGREDRWLLIGHTSAGRLLTVAMGPREQPNTYGLVTARPARREERSFYHEYITQKGTKTDDEA